MFVFKVSRGAWRKDSGCTQELKQKAQASYNTGIQLA